MWGMLVFVNQKIIFEFVGPLCAYTFYFSPTWDSARDLKVFKYKHMT